MNSDKNNNPNLDFLYEIGSLKNVPRAWQQTIGVPVANNIEHSFRVIVLALLLSRMEGKGDENKIMKMAIFHDLCESRSTDIAFLHREYVTRHEDKATKDQLEGTVFSGDIQELLEEYRERKSIESHIVKDADNIDIDLELKELENEGSKMAVHYLNNHRKGVGDKLFTESAKKLYAEIREHSVHGWQDHLVDNWINNNKFNK